MLNVDMFFSSALKTPEITGVVGNRIFNPAMSDKELSADRVPYLIITYDSGTSDEGEKDSRYTPINSCNISILCCAASRDTLAILTELVNDAIAEAFLSDDIYTDKNWSFYINNCWESAGPVQYDPLKPCCYQTLTFKCDT